jgi:hypothetical protein
VKELTGPFLRVWEYFGKVGGFPGQVFFVVAVVILILGGLTWFANRK